MRVKERHSVYATQESRDALNAKIRAKFEKEAHDREREDINVVVDIYRRFVNRNAMMELMK